MTQDPRDRRSGQRDDLPPIFGSVGRGSGAERVDRAAHRDVFAAVHQRVRRLVGVEIVDEGVLDEPYAGHPPGTRYLVIQADCVVEREQAACELKSLAGLTDLAWEYGWRARQLESDDLVSELAIFPGRPIPQSTPTDY